MKIEIENYETYVDLELEDIKIIYDVFKRKHDLHSETDYHILAQLNSLIDRVEKNRKE